FTLSLSRARAKMAEFGSSDPARYLVSVLSGGIGGGAVCVRVRDAGAAISIWMEGGHFREEQLLAALESSVGSEYDGALDLILGCRGALKNSAESVEIFVRGTDRPGYRWLLQQDSEESEALPEARLDGIEVEIRFKESVVERIGRFFRSLRGYVGQRVEFRLVERLMDHSPVPIYLDGERIDRPFFLPTSPLELEIGSRSSIPFSQAPMNFETRSSWSGGLACRAGRISIVVRGVVCGTVESDDFSGVVYHDSMGLDLTREKIVEGAEATRFLAELEEVRLDMLSRLALALPHRGDRELPWFFGDLFPVLVEQDVPEKVRAAVMNWIRASEVREASVDALLEAGVHLVLSGRHSEFRLEERWLLERCAAELRRSPDTLHWSPLTLDFYQKVWPRETLVRGYLLLGMGAVHEQRGRPEQAQHCWLQALDTVRAGTDDRAEELIHAHMDFELAHILSEAGKALALQAR
ncbi:MAG: hypothetical protein KC800_32665, partial [Candidatus Eremiobacteraeota bacterium]|nr:hypothetical protein [Candidatus Eremiobacteraeota bacterium]